MSATHNPSRNRYQNYLQLNFEVTMYQSLAIIIRRVVVGSLSSWDDLGNGFSLSVEAFLVSVVDDGLGVSDLIQVRVGSTDNDDLL